MDIEQLSSFYKLSLGDKRKHLYAIYVIEDLIAKGLITIVNDDFDIYKLDIGYLDTFDSRLYNKMQGKAAGARVLPRQGAEQSSSLEPEGVDVPETPSKTPRKPRAKKTDEVVVDENGVPATPSKTPRKPRAKKTDEVVLDENGVPETPSKKASKPRAKKTELVPIAEDPVQPVEQVVEQVVVPETPSKKASKPRAKKTDEVVLDENGVPETPSKKARKPRAKKEGELTIIPEEILPTPIVREELVTVPAAPAGPEAPDVQPVEQTVADKIIDCIPDTKGKKKTADKPPKTPSKKNNKTAEPIVAEPIADRPVTPELVEEELPIISIVEAETEDGVTVTYLLEEKTGKIYNADDHKLKTQIGILSEEGDLQLFE